MAEENSLECSNCGEKTIAKPKILYSVFDGKKQPDGVCENCGAFYWKRPNMNIPFPVEKLLDEEEKRRERRKEKKKRWLRNRRLKRAMEVGKSRV